MKPVIRAHVWRWRWALAAACLGLAIAVVVLQLRPPAPATTPVLVAAHDLSAGTVLSEGDLQVRHDHHPPPHQPQAGELLGMQMAVGLPAGMPLATTMTVGPGLAEGAPPDTVVVPVRLADAAVLQLARPGDLVDLYLAPADTGGQREEADLISRGAVVLSLPEDGEGDGGLLGPQSALGASTEVVILAVKERDATLLTGASGFAPLRAVLTNHAPD